MSFTSFFDKVGSALKKLFGSTTWEKQAQGVIIYVAPILETVLMFADPAIEPLVAGAINTAKADLATVSAVVSSGTVPAGSTAAATVEAALGSVKTNLTGILTAAGVKNSSKVAQITEAVNAINSEIDALIQNMPGAVPSGA